MQRTAISWLVYTITHFTLMLGASVFASQFPSFLLSLYGGIISDRYNRHKILLLTQAASMVQAILLAILTLTNHYQVWEILFLSVILGAINAFDVPARQPLVNEMVTDKADLPNALALNSSMVNLARLLGPALSGLVLLKFGAGICFLLNAISFIAVLSSLLLMKLPAYKSSPIKKRLQADFADGLRYLKNTPSLGMVILMLSLISLLVLPYNTLLPVFAKVIFRGNADTFGYINSFIGLGALAGTFFLASLKPAANHKIVLLATSLIFGMALLLFSHAGYFPLAMLFAAAGGFGMMSQTTICITIIQVSSDPEMRGRVMSYIAMAYFGMLPLGSLLIGAVSQKIGAPNTIFCQGIGMLVIAAIFFRFLTSKQLDHTAIEQGITAEDNIVK